MKPYVKANKNDSADAEAICEAASRPSMRFVAVKSIAQQDVQAVDRVRQQLVKTRTALVNQRRGLLAEYGIVIAQGVAHLRRALPEILEDPDNGPARAFASCSPKSASGSSSSKTGCTNTTYGSTASSARANVVSAWPKSKASGH